MQSRHMLQRGDLPPLQGQDPYEERTVLSDASIGRSCNNMRVGSVNSAAASCAQDISTVRWQRLESIRQSRRCNRLVAEDMRGDWNDGESKRKWDDVRREHAQRREAERTPSSCLPVDTAEPSPPRYFPLRPRPPESPRPPSGATRSTASSARHVGLQGMQGMPPSQLPTIPKNMRQEDMKKKLAGNVENDSGLRTPRLYSSVGPVSSARGAHQNLRPLRLEDFTALNREVVAGQTATEKASKQVTLVSPDSRNSAAHELAQVILDVDEDDVDEPIRTGAQGTLGSSSSKQEREERVQQRREYLSAVTIQRHCRGFLARRDFRLCSSIVEQQNHDSAQVVDDSMLDGLASDTTFAAVDMAMCETLHSEQCSKGMVIFVDFWP